MGRVHPFIGMDAHQLYSVFLSRSRGDSAFVEKLYRDLTDRGCQARYFPDYARGGRRLEGEVFQGLQNDGYSCLSPSTPQTSRAKGSLPRD